MYGSSRYTRVNMKRVQKQHFYISSLVQNTLVVSNRSETSQDVLFVTDTDDDDALP